MLDKLANIFTKSNDLPEENTYAQIVAQARQEAFYRDAGVPDTLDGRFDMIVLHVFLLIHRTNQEGDDRSIEYAQRVFDCMFNDMDESLREMGVGDLSVGKKIKKMARVFYGRAQAYENALNRGENSGESLAISVARNVFSDENRLKEGKRLASYVVSAVDLLSEQPIEDILAGNIQFPQVQDNI
ncbi:MAG: ubiquinol-cytochrome C chaperone family protein [Hyphomicrobiales bacterium]